MGVVLALSLNFDPDLTLLAKKWSSKILQFSIIVMGASLNFSQIIDMGLHGITITFISITLTLLLGSALAKLFNVTSPLSQLISVGTAICGGSAISAVAPVIRAKSLDIATAMAIVFILNAAAVFLFPIIGSTFQLSQVQFGTWAALAIHDTSSVVAASQLYGDEALKVGTTLKLTRALWIIPLTIIMSRLYKKSKQNIQDSKPKPWFILWFVLLSLLFTLIPSIHFAIPTLARIAKTGLAATLFLIGFSLNKAQVQSIGWRPIVMATSLWIITIVLSLIYVQNYQS